ncbi:ZIP-like iron-zinc transporter [Neolentinus lepideus HHB14362 ss-1]|uniref:ZIP-like iron-zinc transporter n=1 Tax=Neolentinus lepideus HHB14362 ss-1 TaxID=1314782 RepID=A0A165SID4_9AGAM|nr:ZIP-like iron-zinc transporter [Neolentinus lepideus HHB14362 ss-1]
MSSTVSSATPTSSTTPSPSGTYAADGTYCGSGGGANTYFGLRIASVFIIMACSTFGALFPVLARRTKWLNIPKPAFEFAKYFGSGVIIATAFIHLLDPAMAELGNPCLPSSWGEYPYALAFCLVSIFSIFVVELVAFRWGSAKLAELGIPTDMHSHGFGGPGHTHTHEDEKANEEATRPSDSESQLSDVDADYKEGLKASAARNNVLDTPASQIIGIAILEFGIILHSVLIGMTLAVDPSFKILFVVIIFHQLFEGLGLGSRLAYMRLPSSLNYVPVVGGCLYGLTTPIGIAAGLGIRSTYNPNTPRASIVSGVMDAISAGILIYTGLVELLAHEFLFNREMANASKGKLAYSIICMCFGCGIMALLGKWA